MAAYAWTLQGTTPTTIDVSDIIQFAGLAFGNALFVGSYNDSTHVKTSLGVNKSLGNAPKNSKYISSGNASMSGGASTPLSAIFPTTANCPLKINFSHGVAVGITNHIIFAYDGSVVGNGPVGVDFKVAEQSNTAWTSADGQGNALSVGDRNAALSHDFFFLISCTPESVGLKSNFVIRDELIYT